MRFKEKLEALYSTYNRRCYVHPDPLEFLYDFRDPLDVEVVGFIASSLAYGNVKQILRSVSAVLTSMGPRPSVFLLNSSSSRLEDAFSGFKHRFTTAEDLVRLLWGARLVIEKHGSLQNCFLSRLLEDDRTVVPAVSAFVEEAFPEGCDFLIPTPARGSACKRLNLFLRWMVRRDDVDPGGWDGVPPSKLLVPLDTHMHRIATALGLTKRKQADLRTAIEITEAFRKLCPADPVRYDFVLTRFGIRKDFDPSALFCD
ncbi:MAG: TIGR02757 family protein [Deltaproteobacteria bacterium]